MVTTVATTVVSYSSNNSSFAVTVALTIKHAERVPYLFPVAARAEGKTAEELDPGPRPTHTSSAHGTRYRQTEAGVNVGAHKTVGDNSTALGRQQ